MRKEKDDEKGKKEGQRLGVSRDWDSRKSEGMGEIDREEKMAFKMVR